MLSHLSHDQLKVELEWPKIAPINGKHIHCETHFVVIFLLKKPMKLI